MSIEAPTAPDAVDVILRDGATLRLRPPTADDSAAVVDFFARLSPNARWLRFHGARKVDASLATPFLDPDWDEVGALVAVVGGDGGDAESVVALASYARLEDRRTAEMAFAVADDEQGRGIGTRLLEQLAARARDAGISTFVADVVASNAPALAVFADAGFEVLRERESGEVVLRFPIAATNAYAAHVDERDHTAVVASLRPFFAPHTVAVVGASPHRGSIGGELFRNILAAGFEGTAYPVNRTGEPVGGVHATTSIGAIGEPVDLCVLCVPAEHVVDAAGEALRSGVRALCVISAGFAETGPAGLARQELLLALVRAYGARLLGPNCLGDAVPARGLNATFAPRALPPGRIGFSSQSGALGLALLEKAGERCLGFSAFVSIGNKADVSSNDLLEWWEEDPDTDLVLLYLESFGNPRRFARVARRVAQRKPILALKGGATAAGSRAAGSHTAALASSDVAVDALFRQAGVVRARTLEELLDAAAVLGGLPLPQGRRVGVITNAGGLGILCADACEAAGLELARLTAETREALSFAAPSEASLANPVDLLGSATAATYRAAIPPLLGDPLVDALIVIFVPPVVAGAEEVAGAIRDAVEEGDGTKPVVAVVVSAEGTPAALRGPGVPVATLPYPEAAARALALAVERAEWLRRPTGREAVVEGIDRAAARRVIEVAPDGWLDAARTRRLLLAYGIPLVPEVEAKDADRAAAAARKLGFPVVVKTALPGAHKSELGGVALDLRNPMDVRAAVARIGGPVLVQPYRRDGVELLAGAVQDPVFGPLVAFGPGGTLAELIGEATFRLAPLTDLAAHELVTTGKAGRLTAGFRGPAAGIHALVDLVVRLGRLVEDFPAVAELDLNPVLAGPDACMALDARVRIDAASAVRRPHLRKSW